MTREEMLALVNEIQKNVNAIREDWADPRYECRAITLACSKLREELRDDTPPTADQEGA